MRIQITTLFPLYAGIQWQTHHIPVLRPNKITTDFQQPESDESDTESVQCQSNRRRRLQLTWNSEQQDVPPPIVVQDPPDSHDERVARVRQTMRQERRERQFQVAEQFILSVVDRVGPIPMEGGIPCMLHREQWSVLNVPLMWSAAEGNRQCWTLEWLASRAELLPPRDRGWC